MLSPMSAPEITAAISAKYSPTPSTAVEATSTMVSPGTTRPISTEVSSMMPSPARSVRATGSTACTVSRTQSRSSFTIRAYRRGRAVASD